MGLPPKGCTTGGATASCMKKFMVHFRRPENYQGQYGFDWLREDYIKPNKVIYEKDNQKLALSRDPAKLKAEYKKDVKNPIAPHGKEYFPAWLSLFAYIQGKKVNEEPNISTMTKDGVTLDLYIQGLEPLANDGTQLLFSCTNPNVKLSRTQIPLASALSTKIKDPDGTKTYFHLKRAINIKCVGGWLNGHEEVKVHAKLGSTKIEVGKLMLYDNRIIKHADIVLIPVITEYQNGQPVIPQRVDAYEHLMKRISFNQALIRAEFKRETSFDLTKLPQHIPDIQFIMKSKGNTKDSKGKTILGTNGTGFAQALRNLYNSYGPHQVHGGIDQNGKGTSSSKKTFVFLTTKRSAAGGICTLDGQIWGDMVIVFASNLYHAHSYPHELGHSFSLPHTFQKGGLAKHSLYRGYTENYMDYSSDATEQKHPNPFHDTRTPKPFTFYKWQWDIMRSDKSMR